MRKKTVKIGMNLMTAGIVLVIIATFFHSNIAAIFFLPPPVEARFIYLGLFWGGIAGCVGVVVAVVGMLRSEISIQQAYLTPSVVILAAVIVLFFVLLFSFLHGPDRPRFHPGESIVI